MAFVSYAQNFEDVLLWRALGHIAEGFYVDVGAWDPEIDSVTRAFYDRDWCGINIEPDEHHAARLRAARPRDLTLAVAASDHAGEAILHVALGTGLSSLIGEFAAGYRADGMEVRPQPVGLQTLAEICRAHAPEMIHFLKIDAEGSERAVLAGCDFVRFRPWIVLVEATAPRSPAPTHAEWEPLLLAAGYRFLWFDGLNRFYAAAERHAGMAPHFRVPVNVFDDVVRAEAAQAAELAHARGTEIDELRAANAQLAKLAHDAERELAALRASASWRITAPMRSIMSLLGRAKRGELSRSLRGHG